MKGYKNVGIPKIKQPSVNKELRRQERFLKTQKKNGQKISRNPDTGWKLRVFSTPIILRDDTL
ncbi:MAG: hypothetical protein LUE88_03285 [Clostridiales bacterium]|nr:hypothetical protein [Clostridiales bacterium]